MRIIGHIVIQISQKTLDDMPRAKLNINSYIPKF